MKKVTVNKIIPFSSVDGPGNRTAIFLQGCNIDCRYCHNPETHSHCISCGICLEHCPSGALIRGGDGSIVYNEKACLMCDTCIHVCPHDSSPRTEQMDARQVFSRVEKHIPFIRGITVSGGECMLQPEFLTELFELARDAGLSTLIDTNGTIPFDGHERLLSVTDGVMLDIKAFYENDHIRITSETNKAVLDNARFLSERDKLYEVRCVIVPDLYDAMAGIGEMAEFLKPLYRAHPFRIKLIAYRPMGVREAYSHYRVPSGEYQNELADILRKEGFKEIIII